MAMFRKNTKSQTGRKKKFTPYVANEELDEIPSATKWRPNKMVNPTFDDIPRHSATFVTRDGARVFRNMRKSDTDMPIFVREDVVHSVPKFNIVDEKQFLKNMLEPFLDMGYSITEERVGDGTVFTVTTPTGSMRYTADPNLIKNLNGKSSDLNTSVIDFGNEISEQYGGSVEGLLCELAENGYEYSDRESLTECLIDFFEYLAECWGYAINPTDIGVLADKISEKMYDGGECFE